MNATKIKTFHMTKENVMEALQQWLRTQEIGAEQLGYTVCYRTGANVLTFLPHEVVRGISIHYEVKE